MLANASLGMNWPLASGRSISVLSERERHGGPVGHKGVGDNSIVTVTLKICDGRFGRSSFRVNQIEWRGLRVDELSSHSQLRSLPYAARRLPLWRRSILRRRKAMNLTGFLSLLWDLSRLEREAATWGRTSSSHCAAPNLYTFH